MRRPTRLFIGRGPADQLPRSSRGEAQRTSSTPFPNPARSRERFQRHRTVTSTGRWRVAPVRHTPSAPTSTRAQRTSTETATPEAHQHPQQRSCAEGEQHRRGERNNENLVPTHHGPSLPSRRPRPAAGNTHYVKLCRVPGCTCCLLETFECGCDRNGPTIGDLCPDLVENGTYLVQMVLERCDLPGRPNDSSVGPCGIAGVQPGLISPLAAAPPTELPWTPDRGRVLESSTAMPALGERRSCTHQHPTSGAGHRVMEKQGTTPRSPRPVDLSSRDDIT
jgi:hypothetical protein